MYMIGLMVVRYRDHFCAEMELLRKRLDLLLQMYYLFACVADRDCRHSVDRFVGIQLDALPADLRHAVDDVRADRAGPVQRSEIAPPRLRR